MPKICRLTADGGASNGQACVNAANCTPMRLTAGGQGTVWGYCNE